MRIAAGTKVMLPYYDSEGYKQWLLITLQSDVDRRRLYRVLRKLAFNTFNKVVDNTWIKYSSLMVMPSGHHVGLTDLTRSQNINKMVEEFIQRIQYNEIEDSTDTSSNSDNTQDAEQPLCTMQD